MSKLRSLAISAQFKSIIREMMVAPLLPPLSSLCVDFYCPLKYERAHIHMPGDRRREPRVELERVDAEWKCTMCPTNNFLSRTRCRNCREIHSPPSQSTSTGETGAPRRQRSWSEGAAWDSDEAEDTEWAETHPFWHE